MPAALLDKCRLDLRYLSKNYGINHKFTKYLKEGCVLDFDQHFSFKYFLKTPFVRAISSKKSDSFDHCEY